MDRKYTVIVVCLVLLGFAMLMLPNALDEPRQSGVRMAAETRLREIGQACSAYERQNGSAPATVTALVGAGLLDLDKDATDGLVFVGGPTIVAYQAEPCRAVAAGEPWGGPGEVAGAAIPAARAVLRRDGAVEWVDESVFQRTVLPGLRGTGTGSGSRD